MAVISRSMSAPLTLPCPSTRVGEIKYSPHSLKPSGSNRKSLEDFLDVREVATNALPTPVDGGADERARDRRMQLEVIRDQRHQTLEIILGDGACVPRFRIST